MYPEAFRLLHAAPGQACISPEALGLRLTLLWFSEKFAADVWITLGPAEERMKVADDLVLGLSPSSPDYTGHPTGISAWGCHMGKPHRKCSMGVPQQGLSSLRQLCGDTGEGPGSPVMSTPGVTTTVPQSLTDPRPGSRFLLWDHQALSHLSGYLEEPDPVARHPVTSL